MNATSLIEPVYLSPQPQPRVLHVVRVAHALEDLAMDERMAARWRALDDAKRAPVASFLAGTDVETCAVQVTGGLPEGFAFDLSRGGRLFRAAFPGLVRRIASIDQRGEQILIRVACEGEHRATFFGLFSATARRVRFDVNHRLVLCAGTVVEHHVTLDLRALIIQLATAPRKRAS